MGSKGTEGETGEGTAGVKDILTTLLLSYSEKPLFFIVIHIGHVPQ